MASLHRRQVVSIPGVQGSQKAQSIPLKEKAPIMKKGSVIIPGLSAILSLCLLTSCAENPYTGESQMNDSSKGALIGAGGGALIGGLAGGKWGALIGAGAGAAAGGLIGHHMDNLNAELRQQLVGSGVQVRQMGKSVQLIMASDVTFEFNQSNLNPSFYRTLTSIAVILKKYTDTNIVIAGYTDNVGSAAYNQTLSENRAHSVGNYLTAQGVSPNRVFTQGFGERNPVMSNTTESGRAANRRVTITLQPMG